MTDSQGFRGCELSSIVFDWGGGFRLLDAPVRSEEPMCRRFSNYLTRSCNGRKVVGPEGEKVVETFFQQLWHIPWHLTKP